MGRRDDPHLVDARGEFGDLRGDRGRIAGHPPVPVRGEHRQVRVHGPAQFPPVAVVADLRADPPLALPDRGLQAAPLVVDALEGAVTGVRVLFEQPAPDAFEPRGSAVALRPPCDGRAGGPAEELAAHRLRHCGAGHDPHALGRHHVVQHRAGTGRCAAAGHQPLEVLVLADGRVVLLRGERRQARGAQPALVEHHLLQSGDAAGEDEGGARREALVGGGQLVAVVPPERGAQGAVAEQWGDPQEVGAVREGQIAVARPGQQTGVGARDAGGVPGRVDLVGEYDIHALGAVREALDPVPQRPQRAGGHPVLGVHEQQPLARGPLTAGRAGLLVGEGAGQGQNGDAARHVGGRRRIVHGGDDELRPSGSWPVTLSRQSARCPCTSRPYTMTLSSCTVAVPSSPGAP